jgi:hypothetical protein
MASKHLAESGTSGRTDAKGPAGVDGSFERGPVGRGQPVKGILLTVVAAT